MPVFKIVPRGNPSGAVQINGLDGSAALNVASTLKCQEADVWQGGDYLFSARKHGKSGSFWVIFQRPGLSEGFEYGETG